VNAIVFLNYKPVGRFPSQSLLLRNSNNLQHFFELATKGAHPFKVGFDSCMFSGLVRYSDIPPVSYEACDAGRFSMFISEHGQMYPCSFTVEAGFKGARFTGGNISDYWRYDSEMMGVRRKLENSVCDACRASKQCYGGCPAFPSVNLCARPDGARDALEVQAS
jgi:radical SAM protein with 4Fe4S-binding SPASM domain